jgi:hypothetical protein
VSGDRVVVPPELAQVYELSPHLPGVRYVPVSFVARDWQVSARRIRALLAEARLEGIRRANGYWEVAYPYRFTFGQRGPALKRSRKPERRPEGLSKITLQEIGKS